MNEKKIWKTECLDWSRIIEKLSVVESVVFFYYFFIGILTVKIDAMVSSLAIGGLSSLFTSPWKMVVAEGLGGLGGRAKGGLGERAKAGKLGENEKVRGLRGAGREKRYKDSTWKKLLIASNDGYF